MTTIVQSRPAEGRWIAAVGLAMAAAAALLPLPIVRGLTVDNWVTAAGLTVLLGGLASARSVRAKPPRSTSILFAGWLALATAALLAGVWGGTFDAGALRFASYALLTAAVARLPRGLASRAAGGVLAIAGLLALSVWLQRWNLLPDTLAVDIVDVESGDRRFGGLIGHPNFAAAFLALGMLSAIELFRGPKLLLCQLLLGGAAALTGARGVILALAVAAVPLMARRPRLLLPAAISGYGVYLLAGASFAKRVVYISATGGVTGSNAAGWRLVKWREALEVAESSLPFGVGWNQFAQISSDRLAVHSGYLQMWVELGVVGAMGGLLIALAFLQKVREARSPVVTSSALFLLLITATDPGLLYPPIALAVIVGVWTIDPLRQGHTPLHRGVVTPASAGDDLASPVTGTELRSARMDLHGVVSALRHRWFVVVASVLVGVIAAVTINENTAPIYSARSRLFVNISAAREVQEALAGAQLSTQLLESYADVATSRTAAVRIARQLDLRIAPEAIQQQITATPVAQTVILVIRAESTSPGRARDLANAAAAVLQDMVEELEGPASRGGVRARVIDSAVAPSAPIKPATRRNLLVGVVLGGLLGLAGALGLERLDRSVRSAAEASSLTGSPLLALIPRRRDVADRPLLSTYDETGEASVEAYRILRTAIRFVDIESPIRTLLVTSASANEGKTLTAANLALALAESGERVILVDADLRRSQLPGLFGVPAAPGLTTVVSSGMSELTGLRQLTDRLALLPPGLLPPNPSEILGSKAVADLVDTLRGMADIVIFDAPPVLAVTDAHVLATQLDAVVLVVRHGRTQRAHVQEARRRLDVIGATVVGCVLNGVPESASYGDDYAYRYTTDEAVHPPIRRRMLRRARGRGERGTWSPTAGAER